MSDPRITIGGLDLFGVDEYGAEWFVPKNGLNWSPGAGSSVQVVQKARGHGGWAGGAYLEAREYDLSVVVTSPTRAVTERALDRLATAASINETPLIVAEDSVTRWTTVLRDDRPDVSWLNDTTATWSIQLVAPDPRKFGADLSASTGLPSSTGGLSVPFTVPFTIDAVTVSGQVSLTNPGNTSGPVRLRIDGPVTGPIVTHVGSGRALVFASSLVLGAGEFVTVEMERREVLAQGQSSRNGWVTGRGWSAFEPGVNTWSFSALAHDPGASLSVTATPAWE